MEFARARTKQAVALVTGFLLLTVLVGLTVGTIVDADSQTEPTGGDIDSGPNVDDRQAMTAAGTQSEPVATQHASSSPADATRQDSNTTLSGVVVDNVTGAPISDALVVLASDGTTVRTRTGQQGSYRLSLPAGEYAMRVCSPGHLLNETALSVAGEYERRDVALDSLVGQTLDIEGVVQDVQVNVPVADATVTLRADRLDMPDGPVNVSDGEEIDPDLRATLAEESKGTGDCAAQAGEYQALTSGETVTKSPGENGTFAFRNLPPGSYVLTADAPTHENESVDLPRNTTTELLSESRSVRFFLKGPTVNTTGTVEGWKPTDDGREKVELGKFDVNASLVRVGTRTLYGPLHDGYVERGEEGIETGQTSSGFPLGRYRFDAFPTGAGITNTEYRVSAWSAGYQRALETRPTAPNESVDFVLDYVNSTASIAAVSPIYEDDAGDPLPIRGARVTLRGKPGDAEGDNVPATEGVELTAQLDDEGRTTFEDIPPGRYTLVVHSRILRDGNARARFPRRQLTLHVKPGNETEREVELFPELGRINGRLLTFDDPKFQPTIPAERLDFGDIDLPETSWGQFTYQPLVGAQVDYESPSLLGYELTESVDATESGRNGVYGRALYPGTYDLDITKPGFLDREISVGIASGEERTPVTQVAPAEDYFYGVVVMGVAGMTSESDIINERGPPEVNEPGIHFVEDPAIPQGGGYGILRNATLTFEGPEETFTVTSDASGRFVLTAVPEGEYDITVEHPDLGREASIPGSLTSNGTGRLRNLVVTAEPETVNVSVTYVYDPENSEATIRSESYILDGGDGLGKLRARTVESAGGEPVQELPASRTFFVDVPDSRDGGRRYCRLGTTPDRTSFTFTDRPDQPDCGGTTTQVRAFAGHVYGQRDWKPIEGATVELQKRTDDGSYETVGTVTVGEDGYYRIPSPMVEDYPIGDHRLVVNHPTIEETTYSVSSSVPGTTWRDLYPAQEFQEITVTVLDQNGTGIEDADVTFAGDELHVRSEQVTTDLNGTASVGVRTPFEGTIRLSIRAEGYYPVNATTTEVTLTDPGNATDLGTVTTEALPKPAVRLVDVRWDADDAKVGHNTHILSGISDPDQPERTAVRLTVETDRLENLDDGPGYAGTDRIATAEAPYAGEMSHAQWLVENDPVSVPQLRLDQEANGTERIFERQFRQQGDGSGGVHRWESRIDLADLPPTHYVESDDFDTERAVNEPISLETTTTTANGQSGTRESTLEAESIFINRPPSLYNWIYGITGGVTAEAPTPPGMDSLSTRNLNIPARGRAGLDFGTDQTIELTNNSQLRYRIEQGAMFEFGWFESADSLKELTTASEKWGVKAKARTESVVDGHDVVDDASGSVSLDFGLPDKGPLSADIVDGSASGEIEVDVTNDYELPPRPVNPTSVVQGRMAINGNLTITAEVDVGQGAATLFGGVAAQQIAKALSESEAAQIIATVEGGPRAGVDLEIDERVFPYDLQVENVRGVRLGFGAGVGITGTLGMGAATSQANASVETKLRFENDSEPLKPDSGTVRGEAGASVTLLGYTLWDTASRGIIVKQEFGTEGQVYVIERRDGASLDRGYTQRERYATFRGRQGVLVADTYQFARPAVETVDGSGQFLFAHDRGDASAPNSFQLRTSRWNTIGSSDGPAAPETAIDRRAVGGDIGSVGDRMAVAASVVASDPGTSYPLAYLDQTEIQVAVRTDGSWERHTLTDDAFMDIQPRLANGLVVWTVDRDGLPWTTADRLVRYARYTGDGFTDPQTLAARPVVDTAVDITGNSVSLLVETDSNVWTATDRELVQFVRSDGSFEQAGRTVAAGAETVSTAGGMTAWAGTNGSNEVLRVLDDGDVTTLESDGDVLEVSVGEFAGRPLLTWAENESNGPVLRTRLYADGNWSAPLTVERVPANVTDLGTAVESSSARLVATYTVPGEVNGTRTVRYASADVSPLAPELDDDERETVQVPVDILPDDEGNVVESDDERVTVALLGSERFDARDVAERADSVRFGPYSVLVDDGGIESTDLSVEDRDGDGLSDLVVQFPVPENRTLSTGYVVADTPNTTYYGSEFVRFAESDDEGEETPTETPTDDGTDGDETPTDDGTTPTDGGEQTATDGTTTTAGVDTDETGTDGGDMGSTPGGGVDADSETSTPVFLAIAVLVLAAGGLGAYVGRRRGWFGATETAKQNEQERDQ